MRRIPCACTWCVEQLSKPWLPNMDKTLQPCYAIKPETCKYSSILCGYNKWYIWLIEFFKRNKNPDDIDIKDKLVLNVTTREEADDI